MPTAREKAVSAHPSKPFRYRKPKWTCQDDCASPVAFPSGGFLLLNFEAPYRNNLAFSLRLRRHKVCVPEEHGKTYSDLTNDQIRNCDYLFCDLTRRVSHDEFQTLRRICNLRKSDGTPLLVACWLLEKNGDDEVAFQLLVERLFGARIVLCKTPLNP